MHIGRRTQTNTDTELEICFKLSWFLGTVAVGYFASFVLPDFTGGVLCMLWAALVLLIAPQVAIWSDSSRTKSSAWNAVLGAVCLLLLLLIKF